MSYDTNSGYRFEPLDNRDEDDPEYEINPILSSPDFHFSEDDPAMIEEPSGTPAERATFNPEETRVVR